MAPFERTIGAGADVKELEYIAALHQTCIPETRANGTISSLDIQRYLMSRHGLDLSHIQARDIVRGLGGGILSAQVVELIIQSQEKQQQETADASNNMDEKKNLWSHIPPKERVLMEEAAAERGIDLEAERYAPKLEYLDLVQMMSILIMPTLARYGSEFRSANNNNNNSSSSSSNIEGGMEEQLEHKTDSVRARLVQVRASSNLDSERKDDPTHPLPLIVLPLHSKQQQRQQQQFLLMIIPNHLLSIHSPKN
jgi:hypothetical protein